MEHVVVSQQYSPAKQIVADYGYENVIRLVLSAPMQYGKELRYPDPPNTAASSTETPISYYEGKEGFVIVLAGKPLQFGSEYFKKCRELDMFKAECECEKIGERIITRSLRNVSYKKYIREGIDQFELIKRERERQSKIDPMDWISEYVFCTLASIVEKHRHPRLRYNNEEYQEIVAIFPVSFPDSSPISASRILIHEMCPLRFGRMERIEAPFESFSDTTVEKFESLLKLMKVRSEASCIELTTELDLDHESYEQIIALLQFLEIIE